MFENPPEAPVEAQQPSGLRQGSDPTMHASALGRIRIHWVGIPWEKYGAFLVVVGFFVGGGVYVEHGFSDVKDRIAAAQVDTANHLLELQKAIADVNVAQTRESTTLDQMQARLSVLEARMNAKFGADTSAPSMPHWPNGHSARLEKFCRAKCAGGFDKACYEACSRSYNECGIRFPSDPTSDGFRACVTAIP